MQTENVEATGSPKIILNGGGFVRLVDSMGSDLSIVRAARVSFDADWRAGENEKSDNRLIAYLMEHRHSTPFEAVTLTFEVKAPIFVFRQWHRHRTQSYNEISARYTELDEGFYVPEPQHITTQSKDNKQARTDRKHPQAEYLSAAIESQCKNAFELYRNMIADGCPRELARSVLPVAAYSRMFTTMNLHNLFHFLQLRLHPHAQYEIRVYAEEMLRIVETVCPVATEAFKLHRLERKP